MSLQSQVLQAAKLEPSSLELVTRKLEDMLETKNRAIKDLYFEMVFPKFFRAMGDIGKGCMSTLGSGVRVRKGKNEGPTRKVLEGPDVVGGGVPPLPPRPK